MKAVSAYSGTRIAELFSTNSDSGGGATRKLDETYFELGPVELGGWIEHHGWRLTVPPNSVLRWPVLPFNNYGYLSRSPFSAARAMLTTELEGVEKPVEFRVTVR